MGLMNTLAAVVALASVATAAVGGRNNVVLYWGQGELQAPLRNFCGNGNADIINIGFMDLFPEQANGYGGTNFGNQCWSPLDSYVYDAPGNYNASGVLEDDDSKNALLSSCPDLAADIQFCQSKGVKILLSLGGGTNRYQLSEGARVFALQLWRMFGPKQEGLGDDYPRPFDPLSWQNVDGLMPPTVVDGFDLDIEHASDDKDVAYIQFINTLRQLMNTDSTRDYIISAAPQCTVQGDAMQNMINKAQFDLINVQFYNTPQCSLRNWITKNPGSYPNKKEIDSAAFTFDAWAAELKKGASKNAKLTIGMMGGLDAGNDDHYLNTDDMKSVVDAYFCREKFAGVMIWDATYANNNNIRGLPYQRHVRDYLDGKALCAGDPPKPTSTSTILSSTSTISSTSSWITVTTVASSSSSSSLSTSTISPSSSISSTSTKSLAPIPTVLPGGLVTSPDGSCGNKYSCQGFAGLAYACCNQYGRCGDSAGDCAIGCKASHSTPDKCDVAQPSPSTSTSATPIPTALPGGLVTSPDGSCGNKYSCQGFSSLTGYSCCNKYGRCGNSIDDCTGCKESHSTPGKCNVKPSTTSTPAAPISTALPGGLVTSPDGSCGNKYSCQGFQSLTGYSCCNKYGRCGNSVDDCTGCKESHSTPGKCNVKPSTTSTPAAPTSTALPGGLVTSPDGSCGNKYSCQNFAGLAYACCNQYGRCGNSVLDCAVGCKESHSTPGKCNTKPSNTPPAPLPTSTLVTSPDGSCGNKYTCNNFANPLGYSCCNKYGRCGSSASDCGVGSGCKETHSTAGKCGVAASPMPMSSPPARAGLVKSPNGTCGNSYTCAGYGTLGYSCCSRYGQCGSSADHCGTGCVKGYGACF